MNKKIKIIEMLNKYANSEKMPKMIKDDNKYIYEYDEIEKRYYQKGSEKCIYLSFSLNDLNKEVEILEDNTEEIILTEKIFVPMELNLTDYNKNLINNCFESQNALINQIVRAVNKLRKEKK